MRCMAWQVHVRKNMDSTLLKLVCRAEMKLYKAKNDRNSIKKTIPSDIIIRIL